MCNTFKIKFKRETLANDEDVKAVDGVVNVINKAGQYQVLIGIEVPHVFEEFEKLVKVTKMLKWQKVMKMKGL